MTSPRSSPFSHESKRIKFEIIEPTGLEPEEEEVILTFSSPNRHKESSQNPKLNPLPFLTPLEERSPLKKFGNPPTPSREKRALEKKQAFQSTGPKTLVFNSFPSDILLYNQNHIQHKLPELSDFDSTDGENQGLTPTRPLHPVLRIDPQTPVRDFSDQICEMKQVFPQDYPALEDDKDDAQLSHSNQQRLSNRRTLIPMPPTPETSHDESSSSSFSFRPHSQLHFLSKPFLFLQSPKHLSAVSSIQALLPHPDELSRSTSEREATEIPVDTPSRSEKREVPRTGANFVGSPRQLFCEMDESSVPADSSSQPSSPPLLVTKDPRMDPDVRSRFSLRVSPRSSQTFQPSSPQLSCDFAEFSDEEDPHHDSAAPHVPVTFKAPLVPQKKTRKPATPKSFPKTQIFADCYFVLTLFDEPQKSLLIQIIQAQHGKILDSISLLKQTKSKFEVYLLSPLPCQTIKYLTCLTYSIPCLSPDWIKDSLSQQKKLPITSYLLPSGHGHSKPFFQNLELSLPQYNLKVELLLSSSQEREQWRMLLREMAIRVVQRALCGDHRIDLIISFNQVDQVYLTLSKENDIPIISKDFLIRSIVSKQYQKWQNYQLLFK